MSDEKLIEKKISSKKVFSGKLLHVNIDEVLLPNGKTSAREYITHPGAAVIIPVLENGDIVMLRQFRYPVNEVLYELPAGKLDKGEDPLECAKRELFEETGYTCNEIKFLNSFYPCIGYSDEKILIYLAKGLTLHKGDHSDEDEFLEVMTMSFQKALDLLKNGKITDSKTIISLFWADKILSNRWT
ncbi:MAG: NUDIX hydrolase [Nitrospinae bacterium]|nr:NUDIX hydrolase [Nitrospinota bacterium]